MNFFLISGPQSSGKTSLIHCLFNYYSTHGYSVIFVNRYGREIQAILEKGGRQILLQSDTDLPGCILALKAFYARYPGVDVIITSCRNEPDGMRSRLFRDLAIANSGNYYIEIPVGRMPRGGTRRVSVPWYLDNMEKIALVSGATALFYL